MAARSRKRPKASGWKGLLTEQRNPRSRELDRKATAEVVRLVLDEDRRGLVSALAAREDVSRGAELMASAYRSGGRIVFAGAGTSGRLGVIEAAECPPTFGTDPRRIRAVIAGGARAVFRAVEGAEDRASDGRREALRLNVGDLAVGVSASSVTPYVQGFLAGAQRRGASTLLVTCAHRSGLGALADVAIVVPAGPEILTGSTRLKAGSVTKAVLNAMTTAAMVRLGKTFDNLMVDVRPGSAKLRDRAARIVAAAADISAAAARRALRAAGGEVKTAIVMARAGIGSREARRRLRLSGGRVRATLRPS